MKCKPFQTYKFMRFSYNRDMLKRFFSLLLVSILSFHSVPICAETEEFLCGFTDIGTHEVNFKYKESFQALTSWQNDIVFAKIAIQGFKDYEPTEVEVNYSDLTSATSRIDKTTLKVGFLEEANASLGIGYDTSIPHIQIPEIITINTKASVGSNEWKYIWIEIPIPTTQEPGVYEGTFTIQAENIQKELTLSLTVLPITLNSYTDNYSVSYWQYPFASLRYYEILQGEEPFSEKHQEVLKEELKIYEACGGRSVTVSILDEPWGHQTYDDYPSMIDWKRQSDYSIYFDFSKFDKWVELNQEMGIDGRIDTFSILPFDNVVTYVMEDGSRIRYPMQVGSQEWKDVWTYFLESYIQHLESKGWFERTYMFIDERAMADVEEAVRLIRSVTNEKGESLKIATAINRVPNGEPIYDEMDYVSISIAATPDQDPTFQEFIEHRKQLGLETTLYNCSTNYPNAFAISEPEESIWTMEYLACQGFDGYLRWAFDAWNEDPNVSLDYTHFEAGDILLIYPDTKEANEPLPRKTTRLELIGYGLRNAQKYQQLKQELPTSLQTSFLKQFENMQRGYGTYNAYGSMVATEQASIITHEEVKKQEDLLNQYARLYLLAKEMKEQ